MFAARVAPHAGAWIETRPAGIELQAVVVAPHAGAWIETGGTMTRRCWPLRSRPTRARGLKPCAPCQNYGPARRAPSGRVD